MLINLRNALMAGKKLPYDNEVEFLESTGTQWIDTGVAGQSGIDMDFGFSCTSVGGSAQAIGGCWTALQALYVGLVRANGYFAYHYGNTNGAIVQVQQVAANTYYHVQAHLYNGEQYYILNGNKSAVGAIAGNFVSPLNIHLFRINASTSTYSNGVRIYALKIYVSGVLVRDYIPVRRGTVGYLYDRVSGQLFGNAGTGDFVLGQDVVPVEYIESHGTEYIDTGVVPTTTLQTDVRYLITANNTNYDCIIASEGSGGVNASAYWVCARRGNDSRFVMGSSVILKVRDFNIWHTLTFNDSERRAVIDGASAGVFSASISSNSSLAIFAEHAGTSYLYRAKAKMGYCSFYEKSENSMLRNFQPVRVGSGSTWEGAMMDVLTRRVYRNAGTGAFTYGNDLKYPIPAE